MISGFRIFAFFVMAFVMHAPLHAQDLKAGFVDTEKLLKEAPQSDAARKKLESEFAPRDQKIVDLQKKLKKLDEKQAKNAITMSDSQRRSLERDIISLRRDIKRAKEEFNEDFNLRRNEELAKLQKLIYNVIVKIAKEQNYDIIVSDNVIYASKQVDITDVILGRLREEIRNNPSQNKTSKQN